MVIFPKYDNFYFFDKSAGSADMNEKNVRESCVKPISTRIHNIGHIHKTNFAQTQFSRSYPQKTRFLKKRHFTFFWKYLVCGLKIEISEYPTKVEFITYTPYKYEVNRTKTHEIRAKSLRSVFFPLTVRIPTLKSPTAEFGFESKIWDWQIETI